jgi:hypothetical protein
MINLDVILNSIPEVHRGGPEYLVDIYQEGKDFAAKIERDTPYWEQVYNYYPWQHEYDAVDTAFFRAGMDGHTMPVWTVGWRYGAAPEGLPSRNYRENRDEAGVSMMATQRTPWDCDIYDYLMNRPVCVYGGYELQQKGSDGEPLMAINMVIVETKYNEEEN